MQWALGTVGRVPTDGQVDSGATLTGPREREEREYYCGPGAQQPATSPELQIRRCKIDDTLHFSYYGFLFFAAPASFHAHSFFASLFVYRAFVYQLFLSLCKEYGKKLVDTQSRARLSDVLSKNNVMSLHADIQTVKSICRLLPMIQCPLANNLISYLFSPAHQSNVCDCVMPTVVPL